MNIPKGFLKAAKAITKVARKDKIRTYLHNVSLDEHATATDGHTLFTVELGTNGESVKGSLDVEALKVEDTEIDLNSQGELMVRQGKTLSFQTQDPNAAPFPKWRDLVKGLKAMDAPEGYELRFGFDPRVLKRVLDGFDSESGLPTIVKLYSNGPLDAIVLRGGCGGRPAYALVMPCRVTE